MLLYHFVHVQLFLFSPFAIVCFRFRILNFPRLFACTTLRVPGLPPDLARAIVICFVFFVGNFCAFHCDGLASFFLFCIQTGMSWTLLCVSFVSCFGLRCVRTDNLLLYLKTGLNLQRTVWNSSHLFWPICVCLCGEIVNEVMCDELFGVFLFVCSRENGLQNVGNFR